MLAAELEPMDDVTCSSALLWQVFKSSAACAMQLEATAGALRGAQERAARELVKNQVGGESWT